ncbi:MAG: histidine kinase N-terminal domain-containing protein, partial [Ilumatobacteraceae bacterium]
MPTLVELTANHTTLADDDVEHLGSLIAEWGMLADISFADLLLYAPVVTATGTNWLVVAQVRAATGQTLYHTDL